ncbi:uncharacterized protein LOC126721107 isoform X2 [Quercus robur]|uniref:uncharacterized protein LOC126721107 isoform X2 n=1 Tax=Quercus robur TaxID=38942 RepID=UPI0021613096|nr:uncharacterized protein LOC126721107 isoform X2 [Quercus robur]
MAIRFGSMQGNFWRNTMKPFFDARCEDDSLSSINWVLNLARAAVLRHGVRGLVIDPYNELYHQCLVSHPIVSVEKFFLLGITDMPKSLACLCGHASMESSAKKKNYYFSN